MAKVFTITEGLENLGALKTGGQGSVYKGKRVGEIFTAVKLLPTPIHSEDANDKNYRSFMNEVEKLKKVNEDPSPNVVTIIGSGITETGCLPFIEMDFIEGPDLGELLKSPHDSVFSIAELVKVACHLSNAIAHCHRCDVKHGDIKSNNVKYNRLTGNYMLLDFGLAVMSDEDRRTSLRHAGAIEFMAPEQNNGTVLFQTDVYSFGVIMFELLAGRVPFPLQDSGETARNAVMLSHMETPPPDVLELRRERLPEEWSEEKKELELQVPEWMTSMIYKCLEKKPEDRFENGIQLNEYIVLNSTVASKRKELAATDADGLQIEVEKLLKEKEQLQKQVLKYQDKLKEKEESITEIITGEHPTRKVSKSAFYAVLALAIILAATTIYSLFLVNHSAVVSSTSLPTDTIPTMQQNTLTDESSKTGKSNSTGEQGQSQQVTNNTTTHQTGAQDTASKNNSAQPQATLKKPDRKPSSDSSVRQEKDTTSRNQNGNEQPDNQ